MSNTPANDMNFVFAEGTKSVGMREEMAILCYTYTQVNTPIKGNSAHYGAAITIYTN